MKKALLFAIAIAALALAGTACYKTRNLGQTEQVEARKTETVAYLSDIERRIAMFIVPVNYTTNGPWTSFELKASTNNFCHKAADGSPIGEDVFMQYFMDSDVADVGGTLNGAVLDHAKLLRKAMAANRCGGRLPRPVGTRKCRIGRNWPMTNTTRTIQPTPLPRRNWTFRRSWTLAT